MKERMKSGKSSICRYIWNSTNIAEVSSDNLPYLKQIGKKQKQKQIQKQKNNNSLLPSWFCIYFYILNHTSNRNDKDHMLLRSNTEHPTLIKNRVKRKIYLVFSGPSPLSKSSSVHASAKLIATKSRQNYLVDLKLNVLFIFWII